MTTPSEDDMTRVKELVKSLERRKNERPFFDESKVPEPARGYVAWLDVMGAESAMRRSHRVAANFVMKLHVAALTVGVPRGLEVYPVVDGMYICSMKLPPLLNYLKDMMTKLALAFVFEERADHRFMVRGGLAFGPAVKGSTALDASTALETNSSYASRILLGITLVQSNGDERRASPFGIYVHESARSFTPAGGRPLPFTHWQWWTCHQSDDDIELATALKLRLLEHSSWCAAHATTILYLSDRIQAHRLLAEEYFFEL